MKRWMIEESIWGPRRKWADSGKYLDTREHMRACFELDFELCLQAHKTNAFISRLDGEHVVEPTPHRAHLTQRVLLRLLRLRPEVVVIRSYLVCGAEQAPA